MEQDKILAVMGSPGSGKTTTAVTLAAALARRYTTLPSENC